MRLIVTAFGDHQQKMVQRVISGVKECDCYVKECRMTRVSGGCAGFIQVEGNWNHIARLENLLAGLGQTERVQYHRMPDEPQSKDGEVLLYVAEVVARERVGIVEDLLDFFSHQGIDIQDLRSSCYQLPYVGSIVCTIHLLIRIPRQISVISLRDEFLDLCEQMQVDAIFEPIKPII